jgi:histone H3/H4
VEEAPTPDHVGVEDPLPTAPPAPTTTTATDKKPKRRPVRRQFDIPRATFRRLVQEIANDVKSDLRFQGEAFDALQSASEELLGRRFVRCSQLAELCKLDTVRDEHWKFVHDEASLMVVAP